MKRLGVEVSRSAATTVGFGILYGMGIQRLAEALQTTAAKAREIRRTYLEAFPNLEELSDRLKQAAEHGEPIRTWGGRLYRLQPPVMRDGRLPTFEYKLLNVLIQGSAADCTKAAMIRAYDLGLRLILSVHDELVVLSETGCEARDMKLLREAMESVEFNVSMISDGKW